MDLFVILVATLHILEGTAFPSSLDCPIDCICYSDYLHNLESWKWVETDVHYNANDPEHADFNPYLEHNEVMENPKLHLKRQREAMLSTVTCMIRVNGTDELDKTFSSISPATQVLSLIQAPGSGPILLKTDHFYKFHSLVGLEVNGYGAKSDIIEISGDCFTNLKSLTYLNLQNILLLQTSVENNIHDINSRFVKINYTFSDIETNEITSQILIITPEEANDDKDVVPYSEYKKTHKEKAAPLQPTFRVAFTALPKLQHLKMSGCNLHDISWDMFYKLESLKYLVLDENDLLFLPDFVFYATSNLTVLSLSGNRILNLQTVGLAGLLYLQKLDVTHNNITHLSELSLPPFPHLEVADFRHNPITAIFPNTFEIMNSTKTLYLGSASTTLDLSPNSFFGLSSLTKLDITNVKIRLLEKSMLKGMPLLKTLIMTGSIPRISYDAFGEVTKLEKIILRHCGIKKISMDAFFGLSALTELDLSYNALKFLPPGIFEEQISLREVFLQHNQLTTLPVNLVENLPMNIIRLEGNPWHCSCDMKNWDPQLTNRVRRFHIPAPNNTLCQKVYDKGSMCFETYEPKFEVTYSYEKRVSPVCETPLKFNQRSVFQVLRKELKYCNTTSKDLDNVKDNKMGTAKSLTLKSKPFPDNFSFDTLTALEKQLLAKPVKIRKNKTLTSQQEKANEMILTNPENLESNTENNDLSNSLVSGNQAIPNLQLQTEDMKNSPGFARPRMEKFNISENDSGIVVTTPEVTINETLLVLNSATPEPHLFVEGQVRTRKGKKKNKNKTPGGNKSSRTSINQESDKSIAIPSISKKAMKLAKLLAKQNKQF